MAAANCNPNTGATSGLELDTLQQQSTEEYYQDGMCTFYSVYIQNLRYSHQHLTTHSLFICLATPTPFSLGML